MNSAHQHSCTSPASFTDVTATSNDRVPERITLMDAMAYHAASHAWYETTSESSQLPLPAFPQGNLHDVLQEAMAFVESINNDDWSASDMVSGGQ